MCALILFILWFRKPFGVGDPSFLTSHSFLRIIQTEIIDHAKFRERHPQESGGIKDKHRQMETFKSRSTIAIDENSDSEETSRKYHWNDQLITPRALNFTSIGIKLQVRQTVVVYIAMVLICCAYGGVHLSALGFEFPTTTEYGIWKSSCIAIIGSGLTIPLWLLAVSDWTEERLSFHENLKKLSGKEIRDKLGRCDSNKSIIDLPANILQRSARFFSVRKFGLGPIQDRMETFYQNDSIWRHIFIYIVLSVLLVIFLGSAVLSFGARVALVVESFITLRKVPEGADPRKITRRTESTM